MTKTSKDPKVPMNGLSCKNIYAMNDQHNVSTKKQYMIDPLKNSLLSMKKKWTHAYIYVTDPHKEPSKSNKNVGEMLVMKYEYMFEG